MAREIKFRAFDKQKNRMFYVYGLGKDWVTEDTLYGVDEGNNCFSGEEFKSRIEIMQFTGLFDKNGKEIYEEDILRTKFGNQVGFGNLVDYHLWNIKNSNAFNEIEIVGNTYENFELIS